MRVSTEFEPLPQPELMLDTLMAWFGMPPEAFSGHRFWHRPGAKAIWIAAKDAVPPKGVRVDAFGMLVSRQKRGFKPTNVFLQRFGHAAVARQVVIEAAQIEGFLRRDPVPLDGPDAELASGLVIVFDDQDTVLGCGRIKDQRLHSELPKSWTMSWR